MTEEDQEAMQDFIEVARHIERTVGIIQRAVTTDDIWDHLEEMEEIARKLNKIRDEVEGVYQR